MTESTPHEEPLIPDEVLPPEHQVPTQDSLLRRLESAFGPIIAGLLIDVIDLSTFGTFGIFSGMLLGGMLAYWICAIYAIPVKQRWIWVLLAGIYCTIPMTEFIPIATIAGAYVRYIHPPTLKKEEACAEDTP
jgi:hypothetical protein